jgi:mycothiol synthase
MLDAGYTIRAFHLRDCEEIAAIANRLDPDRPVTPEQLRRQHEIVQTPPMVGRQFSVEEARSGRVVATGGLQNAPDHLDPASLWVGGRVDPDHQRRGIGTALAERLETEAAALGAVRLFGSAPAAAARSVRFLQRRGFAERRRVWRSRLDLSASDLSGQAQDREEVLSRSGLRLVSLAREGSDDVSVVRELHDLVVATEADVPRMEPYVAPTLEEFVDLYLRGPGFLPQGFFLARLGTQYVAMSNLERIPGDPAGLHQNFTATRSEFRGRGVATTLKLRTIAFARENGYQFVLTENDSLNDRIWSINQRLGFRREREMIFAEKTLGQSARRTA